MNGVLQRGHLQFRKNQAQLFHRSCGSRASIADECSRLAIVFGIGIVECVLEHGRQAVIVLGCHEDVAVDSAIFLPQRNAIALFGGANIGDLSSSKNGIG